MPSLAVCAARLARSGGRRAGAAGASIPRIEAYAAFAPDPGRLAAFRGVCGYGPGEGVPPTWPYAVATPLHLYLVTSPEFPLPALGLVHVREVIVLCRPIAAEATLHFRCRVEGQRPHARGVEFDLITEVATTRGGPTAWRSTTTALWRAAPRAVPLRAEPGGAVVEGVRWRVEEAVGRRYACVSRNFDPIHMYSMTARLFGLKRPIAHGMWLLARSLAALGPGATAPPCRIEARFRSPLFLPGEVVFSERAGEEGQRRFAVHPARGGRAHLEGEVSRL